MPTVMLSDPNAICSAVVLGKVIGLTDRHVRELVRDGVLKCARTKLKGMLFRLGENVQRYQAHQRKVQEPRGSDAYERARTRRMENEADRSGLLLRQLKGELHTSQVVLFVLTNGITATRAHLLAIPARVTLLLKGETDEKKIYNILYGEIETALRSVSELREEDFTRRSPAFLKSLSSGNGN